MSTQKYKRLLSINLINIKHPDNKIVSQKYPANKLKTCV